MLKFDYILGAVSGGLFILGILFRVFGISGDSILLIVGVLVYLLVFLPMQMIRVGRKRPGRVERIYGAFKYMTAFFILGAITLDFNRWPGSGIMYLAGSLSLGALLLAYFYLRQQKRRKQPFSSDDLTLGLITLGIFVFFITNRVSADTSESYQRIEAEYLKMNEGIEISNEMLYTSMASSVEKADDDFIESLIALRQARIDVVLACQESRDQIISIAYDPEEIEQGSERQMSGRFLSNRDIGAEVMIVQGNASRVKNALADFRDLALEIAAVQNLQSNLIGMGLETTVERTSIPGSNVIPTWETEMFEDLPAGATLVNLAWIQQMALLTEANVLSGVIDKVDLSADAAYVQELAAQESRRAMQLKENEILRIQQARELQDLQLAQAETEKRQQRVFLALAVSGIAFVLILLGISMRAFYRKRKDNLNLARQQLEITHMNEELNQRHEEITAQNDEILAQRDEIEAQRDMVFRQKDLLEKTHGEITSSIDYAKRLQTSILPSTGLLRTRIKDHFVLYLPKHRVSGDFYWWTQVENNVVITAADCTGHGVPGAFMSMLGVSMLREIVSKEYISHPGVILRRLRKEVMHALKQTGEFGEQKDGMDMALVSINVDTLECQYAGANNPLYLVRDGELTEFKADRMPIAIHQNMARFKTHDIQLQSGDRLYMFSDGYADQFGGPEGKKFKYKALREFFVDHASVPMRKQKQALEKTFTDWKGKEDQVDDVVVIGLEV